MIVNQRGLALQALQEAMQLRRILKQGIWDPVCPYDCAQSMGIEVRFDNIPTLEGIYVKQPGPVILVSSLRPPGRAAYSCSHEIGHHVFKHGTRIDHDLTNIYDAHNNADEFLAQVFAGYFLMPKSAVEAALAKRTWRFDTIDPIQIFTIANWFGVGYGTIIDHLQFSLKILPNRNADGLRKTAPQEVKASITGQDTKGNLILVDQEWSNRAIDVETGDLILLWPGIQLDGNQAQFRNRVDMGVIYEAIRPGIGLFHDPKIGWSSVLRVRKRGYTGRSVFRHLADHEYYYEEENGNT